MVDKADDRRVFITRGEDLGCDVLARWQGDEE